VQVCLFDNSRLLEKATRTVNNRDDGVFRGKMKGALALIHTIVRVSVQQSNKEARLWMCCILVFLA
jgi:hypothetical protein